MWLLICNLQGQPVFFIGLHAKALRTLNKQLSSHIQGVCLAHVAGFVVQNLTLK